MKLEPQVVLSRSEEERIARLSTYFDDYLAKWFAMLLIGVRQTPGVSRALAFSLLKHAAAALLASTDEAMKESDEKTAARCEKAASEMIEILERQVHS